ncbi:MAG TPA: efflux RND transporter periplasmic adaptor subunit, partial [Cytophagaceae bacterium]|nr:efflux RND transporter periplasmic adaptor subunit [Cytophagaceae bacterium]
MKKHLFIFVVLVLMQACHEKKEDSTSSKFELSPLLRSRLKLTTATEEDVQGQLYLNGKVSAFEDKLVKISPLVDGVIQTLNANLGDYVTKGQTLAVIKSTDVADAENQANDAEATLRSNEKNLNVTKDMARLGLAAEKDIVLAENEVNRAKGAVRRSHEVSSLYEIKNSLYTMKAPISGYVIDKNLTLSTQLSYDNSQVGPFYTIADLSMMQIVADVYEADIANIKIGEQVQIKILAFPNQLFKGKIEKIQDLIDPQTRTMKIRISIPNPDIKLKPEMFAQILVDFDEGIKMISVPTAALIFENSKYYALVYHSDKDIEVREVQMYQAANGKTYLKRGLKVGEKIMASDQLIVF